MKANSGLEHDDSGDPRDQMLEAALRETLGGEQAPDLKDKILARLAAEAGASLQKDTSLTTEPNRSASVESGSAPPRETILTIPRRGNYKIHGFVAGAAMAAALVASIIIIRAKSLTPDSLPVLVRSGIIEHRSGENWITRAAPSDSTFAAATGDRFRSGANQQSILFMSDLGTLWVRESTEIEVLQMNWNDFGKGAVLGSVTIGVVAGSIYWFSGNAGGTASAGETRTLTKADGNGGEVHAKLIEDLNQAKAKIREYEEISKASKRTEALANTTKTNTTESAPAIAVADKAAGTVAFTRSGLEDALAKVDWKAMGDGTKQLAGKLQELAQLLEKGEKPSMELMGDIQAMNGLLIKATGILVENGVPGEGPNSTFTHPMVVANLLATLMKSGGAELTAAQSAAMNELAQKLTDQDDFRRSRYAEGDLRLQHVIDEIALRARFYKEAAQLLSPEQAALVDYPGMKGRTGLDILGTGVAWAQFARPMPLEGSDSVSASMIKNISGNVKINDTQSADVAKIVNKWMDKYPQAYWSSTDSLSSGGIMSVESVEAAAKIQLEMYKDIASSGVLNPEQQKALMENPVIYVPFVSQKKK
ncbi:MAG: hypothetical protein ACKVS6_04030 [Planctomycetota bacterium]